MKNLKLIDTSIEQVRSEIVLANIIREERNLSSTEYRIIKPPLLAFKPSTKSPFKNTEGIEVLDNDNWYKLTKKSYPKFGYRSICGKSWTVDYQFKEIRKLVYLPIDLSEFIIGKYRNSLGNGWYNDTVLYRYKGVYYADLT